EAVGGEAQVGQQANVVGIAVIVVAGIAAGLGAGGAGGVLPGPPVVVPVPALDLVGRRGRAADEALRKRTRWHGPSLRGAGPGRRDGGPAAPVGRYNTRSVAAVSPWLGPRRASLSACAWRRDGGPAAAVGRYNTRSVAAVSPWLGPRRASLSACAWRRDGGPA